MPVADLLFFVLIVAPIALNALGWWLLVHLETSPGERWRKYLSRVGLVANLGALAIPWGMFFYNYAGLSPALPEDLLVKSCLSLALISIVSGVLSPARVAWPLTCSGVLVGLFWLVLPRGV